MILRNKIKIRIATVKLVNISKHKSIQRQKNNLKYKRKFNYIEGIKFNSNKIFELVSFFPRILEKHY